MKKERFIKRREITDCDLCCRAGKQTCDTNECKGGYYVAVKPKRAGKYERLLKALLKNYHVECYLGEDMLLDSDYFSIKGITKKQNKQLIAIRERMK